MLMIFHDLRHDIYSIANFKKNLIRLYHDNHENLRSRS